jgi:hypothetical protein
MFWHGQFGHFTNMEFLMKSFYKLVLPVLVSALAEGAVPTKLNFQGILTDTTGAPVSDGTHSTVFKFYTVSSGGAALWQESINVTTTDGLFTTLLGETNMIDETIFPSVPIYLGVAVDGAAEMTPRTEFTSVPWAIKSKIADGVQNNSVNSQSIQDGSVTLSDLGQNGATNGKIMKWQGSGWAIANDSAGDGLSSGIASTHTVLLKILPCDSMIDIATVTITTPSAGYIFVVGKATLAFGNSNSQITILVQIDETAGGLETNGFYISQGLSGYTNTATDDEMSVYVDRVYQKPAGTYTFRLEGRGCSFDVAAEAKAYFQSVTAMYFPTAMGAVSATE